MAELGSTNLKKMSTQDMLLNHLPQEDGGEPYVAALIYDFSRSRTVDELEEHSRTLVLAVTPEKHGMTPQGFLNIIGLGLNQSLAAAKNCFNRARYDTVEWANLGPALQQLVQNGL